MNLGRETILAAVVGFLVGLLAAWAVWNIPQLVSKKETPPSVQEQETLTTPQETTFTLNLTQPDDGTILNEAEATIAGQTETGATVVINSPLEDKVIEATEEGKFSATLGLEEGVNEIVVTAYSPSGKAGEEKTETRTVTYTKEEF